MTEVAASPAAQPAEVVKPGKPQEAEQQTKTATEAMRAETTKLPDTVDARNAEVARWNPKLVINTARGDDGFEIVNLSDAQTTAPPSELINQKAKALKEAIDHKWGIFGIGLGADPQFDQIRQILDPLSPQERQAIEKRYQELYDPSRPYNLENSGSSKLRSDLAAKLGSDPRYRQIEAMLDRKEGVTNDAGQAMEALAEISKNRLAGETQLRGVFATLNAQDSQRLQKEFEEKYGKTIDQAMKDANVSPETFAYVEAFRTGSDKRSADDLVRLANLAMDGAIKGRENFMEEHKNDGSGTPVDVYMYDNKEYKQFLKDVLAGSSPASVEARRKLQEDPNFESKFARAFGELGGTTDAALRDYVIAGGRSLSTIVAENMNKTLGFMLNNPDSVTLATQNVSQLERENFARGRKLAGRENDDTLKPEERAALDYYNRTHESLTRGAGNKPLLAATWEANILYGKDNIISTMAATHESGLLSSSHTTDSIVTAAENLSEKDWKRLNEELKDPSKGGRFRADIAASLDVYAPAEKERILSIIDAKVKAPDYVHAQDIRRGFADIVADKTTTNWLGVQSRDAAGIVDGIINLSPNDIKRYQKETSFRDQVDKTVADSLTGSDQLLAKRLLEKAQNVPAGEKIKPDAIDQVLIDKTKDAKPEQILRDIQAAYQLKDTSGKTLQERLNSGQPLSATDQVLARIIETQADKAISNGLQVPQNSGNSPEGRKPMVTEFLQTGKLSLNLMSAVGYPLVDVLTNVGSATEADLTDLRARLTTDQQKILDVAVAQKDDPKGSVHLEDKLRSFVLGDSTNPDQFKEQLKNLSDAEKVELKRAYAAKYGNDSKPADLDKDFLSKLSKTEQTEYVNLLSTGAREGRQSFYDNLREFTKKSGVTLDGTESNMERAVRQQQDAMEQYQRVYQTLPKEKQELLDQYFNDSLGQYKKSKEELSELAVNAAITATALAAAPMSAGMSLSTIALISAGGGAFRLAAREAMIGSDFDASGANVTKEIINGSAAAALNFLGAKQIDAIMTSAQESGAIFGAYLKERGVSEATALAAAKAAGFSMDVLAGGTIGAATNVGSEVALAPVNGHLNWDSVWNSAVTGFALGAVIPVAIKGLQGVGRGVSQGADGVMNLTRGERTLLWNRANNPQRALVNAEGEYVVGQQSNQDVPLTSANNYRQVETDVESGKLVNKATREPLRTGEGLEIDEQGRPILKADPLAPDAVQRNTTGEGDGKSRELFDPSHRSIDEVPEAARAEAREQRKLYSRQAAEAPDAPLVDASDVFAEWRAKNPELNRRATDEVAALEAYEKARGSGDRAKVDAAKVAYADAVKATDSLLKERGPQIESVINRRLAAEGRAPIKVDIAGALDGDAAFSFDSDGNPRIAISRRALLSDESKLQELINHETDHYLQVALEGRRVRELAENGGSTLDPNSPADLERFRKAYAQHMQKNEGGGPRGGMPSDDYLRSLMKAEPLTEAQRVLADRLLAAAQSGAPVRADSIETANLFGEIGNKARPLAEQIKANEQAGIFNHDIIDEVLDPSNKLLTRRDWDQNPTLTEAKIDEIRKTINSETATIQEKNAKARELLDILHTRQRDINLWREKAHDQYSGVNQIDELYADVAGANGRATAGDGRFGPRVEDERIFDVGDAEHVDGWSRSGDRPGEAGNSGNPYASRMRADLDLRSYLLKIDGNSLPFDGPRVIYGSGNVSFDNPNGAVRIEAGPNGPIARLNANTGENPVVIRTERGGTSEIPVSESGITLRPGDKIRVGGEGTPTVELARKPLQPGDVVRHDVFNTGEVMAVQPNGDVLVAWRGGYDSPPGPTEPGPDWIPVKAKIFTPAKDGTMYTENLLLDPSSGRYFYANEKRNGRMIGAPLETFPAESAPPRPGEREADRQNGVPDPPRFDPAYGRTGTPADWVPPPSVAAQKRAAQLKFGDQITIDSAESTSMVLSNSENGVTVWNPALRHNFENPPRNLARDFEAVNTNDSNALQRMIDGEGDQISIRSKADPAKEYLLVRQRDGGLVAREVGAPPPEGWEKEISSISNPNKRYEYIPTDKVAPTDRLGHKNTDVELLYDKQTGQYYYLLKDPRTKVIRAELAPEFRTLSRDSVARLNPDGDARPADAARPAEAAQPDEAVARPRDAIARPTDAPQNAPDSPPLLGKAGSDWIGNKYDLLDRNGRPVYGPDNSPVLRNDDAHWISDDGDVAMVIDGVGGHGGGDVASDIIKNTVRANYPELPKNASADQVFDWLDRSLLSADAKIRAMQQEALENGFPYKFAPNREPNSGLIYGQRPDGTDIIATNEMSAVVVAAVKRGDQMLIAAAGDSRAYVFRDGKLRQLTHDDSYPPPDNNVITNGIGIGRPPQLQHITETVKPGDRFLFATDGLEKLSTDEIEKILINNPDAETANKLLIEAVKAKARPGRMDNTTAIVLAY